MNIIKTILMSWAAFVLFLGPAIAIAALFGLAGFRDQTSSMIIAMAIGLPTGAWILGKLGFNKYIGS